MWSILCDVRVLSDCGSVLDCGSLALLTCLKVSRRPQVLVTSKGPRVFSSLEKTPLALSFLHLPLLVTLGLTSSGLGLTDLDKQEEEVFEGKVCFVLNQHREVCGVHKVGCVPLSAQALGRLASDAMVVYSSRHDAMVGFLEQQD